MIQTIKQERGTERKKAKIVYIEIAYPIAREEDPLKYLHHSLSRHYVYSAELFEEIKTLRVERLERQLERQKNLDVVYGREGSNVPALAEYVEQVKKAKNMEELVHAIPADEDLRKTNAWEGLRVFSAITE